ncbi:protoporphyrinogen oxidase [soil metagenome]
MFQSMTFDVAIIGAGLDGLVLGRRLAAAGRTVALIDGHPGGRALSDRAGEYVLEFAAKGLVSDAETIALVTEVGLSERVQKAPREARDRYIWRHRKLRRVPRTAVEILATDLLPLALKARLIWGLYKHYPWQKGDVEIGKFLRIQLGDDVVSALVKPVVAGMFAADADRISLEMTFPDLFDELGRHKRLLPALGRIKERWHPSSTARARISFPDGAGELRSALVAQAEAGIAKQTLFRSAATGLEKQDGAWSVTLSSGEKVAAQKVVLATDALVAAELLRPHAAGLADFLSSVEYAPLTVVHASAAEGAMGEKRSGAGCTPVAHHGVEATAVLWTDKQFPGRAPAGRRLITCHYGGESYRGANSWDEKTLLAKLAEDLQKTMQLQGEPEVVRITRIEKAVPVFRLGHMKRLVRASEQKPADVLLLGNYLGGISPSDRIAAANKLAREIG